MWELLLSKFLDIATSSLKKYWKLYFVGGLVALNLITAWGWEHEHKSLVQERANHQLDINHFKDAQREADTNAKALAQKLKDEGKAKANEADKKYSNLLAQYRASVLRYKANQSSASSSGNSEFQSAPSSNGPSSSSSILITIEDANICAVNTARLQAVHDWTVDLPH